MTKNSPAVGVDFDRTDGSPSEEFSPENSSTSARQQSQLIHSSRKIGKLGHQLGVVALEFFLNPGNGQAFQRGRDLAGLLD